MVEISLSGSGEGPGKVTTRGYSTISRCCGCFPLKTSPPGGLWEVSRHRFFGEQAFCGRYLRSAEIGCPRKSHPSRHLQRSVSSRIDNLPERDAGLRDFALVPQLPLEFPGCPALHGAQRARHLDSRIL